MRTDSDESAGSWCQSGYAPMDPVDDVAAMLANRLNRRVNLR